MPATELGPVLLDMARQAIAGALGAPVTENQPAATGDEPDWLLAMGSTFVTLTQQERLRGCIGSLEAWRPLKDDVRANAVSAALRDPRFEPLRPVELHHTRVEVSLLSAPEPLSFSHEAEALAQLRPGVDGIVLEHGRHRSTFLPQVWEQLPEPAEFIAQLKRKAGLPVHFWSPELRLQRYTVTRWKERT